MIYFFHPYDISITCTHFTSLISYLFSHSIYFIIVFLYRIAGRAILLILYFIIVFLYRIAGRAILLILYCIIVFIFVISGRARL